MNKLKLNLLISSLSIVIITNTLSINAMQETQDVNNVNKNKQLAIISTPNKDRRIMLYNPELEKERLSAFKESAKPETKPVQEKKDAVESKTMPSRPSKEVRAPKNQISTNKPKPTRPSKETRAPKKPVSNQKENNLEKLTEAPIENQEARTIYSDILSGNYSLKKTGNLEKLLKNESIARPVSEKVEPLIFYTSSRSNMEKLFNKLIIVLGSANTNEAAKTANFEEIISILSAAALEIKKINQGQQSLFKKQRLIALIRYAWQNHPSDITYDLKERMKKFGNLGLDFNAPVFDKDTFK